MRHRFGHGLVIGKFYPPHLGHHHLISSAAGQCEEVTVLVMAAAGESIPGSDRATWLASEHARDHNVHVFSVPSDAPVDYTDDVVWTAQVALMRVAVAQVSHHTVDAVFTSEPYGDELAARLGAEHVLVDPERSQLPISGRALRDDLATGWDSLAPATKAGLALRVVLVGAESTGTSTISSRLLDHYRARGGTWERTRCVAEYGREYSEVKWIRAIAEAQARGEREPSLDEILWTNEEFDRIAREQTRREEAAAADGSPLLICDTDAFATAVWERRYLRERARQPQPWATDELPRRGVYLLTSHEGVPWVDDGLREGDLDIRAAMTTWFADELTRAGHSWVLLTGDLEQRVRLAATVIDRLLAEQLSFAPSITDRSATPRRIS